MKKKNKKISLERAYDIIKKPITTEKSKTYNNLINIHLLFQKIQILLKLKMLLKKFLKLK